MDVKKQLMEKIDELRPKFKAETAFYPDGENVDGMRFRDTERIASRVISGSACAMGQKNPTIEEIAANLDSWAKRGLEDAAYGDYYYKYEKQW